jgi:uncharacterized membrane protein YfcA
MPDWATQDFLNLAAMGFLAQLIDGALGMAYGVVATLTLLSIGASPAAASAAVHTAEVATCAASGGSHLWHKNVDKGLVARLLPAGVLGAVIGATFLSNVDAKTIRPFIALYLGVVGFLILQRAGVSPKTSPDDAGVAPLGFVGGLLDSLGGGWGPIVASTLVGRGHPPRYAVGSVNLSEFFVAASASATFFAFLGWSELPFVAALVLGGLLAAPLSGYVARVLPTQVLMRLVGIAVLLMAGWQIWRTASGV